MSKDRIDVKSFQRHAEIIDYQGKLAYTWGWDASKEKPVETRDIKVSKIKASDWSELLGMAISDWSSNTGVIYRYDRPTPTYIHAEDFSTIVKEERPLTRPRRGKDRWGKYDWKYVGDGYFNPYWEKVYLPGEE